MWMIAHWGGSQSVPCGLNSTHSQSQVFYQDCSCYYSQILPVCKSCVQGWNDAGWGRRRPERRACLLHGPWLLTFPMVDCIQHSQLLHSLHSNPQHLGRTWGLHAPLCPQALNVVPGFGIFSFSLSALVRTFDWYQNLVGKEGHLYRSSKLMPIIPSQSEGVGHSPECAPCYNSLNQVTEHFQGKQAESFKQVRQLIS